jgi:hypothetical protein
MLRLQRLFGKKQNLGTRSGKRTVVGANTTVDPAAAENVNYLKQRNVTTHSGLNNMVLRSSIQHNVPLTNSQIDARKKVIQMMVNGQTVSNEDKHAAGIPQNNLMRRYNQAVRNVTARLLINRDRAIENPKVVLTPAASREQAELLGRKTLSNLYAKMLSNARLKPYHNAREQAVTRSIQKAISKGSTPRTLEEIMAKEINSRKPNEAPKPMSLAELALRKMPHVGGKRTRKGRKGSKTLRKRRSTRRR